jgi:RHS repeat-associated protein
MTAPCTIIGGRYRFGFNGAEKIDEIYGDWNGYDLGARMYDPRLGKMFSTDPREAEYAWQSTYAYYANSPINTIDFNGEGNKGDGYYLNSTPPNNENTFLGRDNTATVSGVF